MFTARIFPSQGDRFQLEPGDSSPVGRGYRRDGWGGGRGGTAPTPLLLGPGLDSHPLWEMQGGPSEGAAGLLEKRWEALGTRDLAQQGKNMAGLILQALTSSSRCMHQEGCRLEFHPQVGLHLLRPGSLASRDQQPWREVALLSLSSASFRHLAEAPQPPPGSDSFLVTFPAPMPSDLSSAGSSLPLPFLQGADSLPSFPTSFSHCQVLGQACTHREGGLSQGTSWAPFSVSRTMRLPLALGRAGLEARWTGDGWTWLQAIGKTGYQRPEPGTVRVGHQETLRST